MKYICTCFYATLLLNIMIWVHGYNVHEYTTTCYTNDSKKTDNVQFMYAHIIGLVEVFFFINQSTIKVVKAARWCLNGCTVHVQGLYIYVHNNVKSLTNHFHKKKKNGKNGVYNFTCNWTFKMHFFDFTKWKYSREYFKMNDSVNYKDYKGINLKRVWLYRNKNGSDLHTSRMTEESS